MEIFLPLACPLHPGERLQWTLKRQPDTPRGCQRTPYSMQASCISIISWVAVKSNLVHEGSGGVEQGAWLPDSMLAMDSLVDSIACHILIFGAYRQGC